MNDPPKAPAGWFPAQDDPNRERYWDGERWTDAYRAREETPPPTPSAAASTDGKSAVSLPTLLFVVGGLTMLVSVFLPHLSSAQFAQIVDNTMIQSDVGWAFVGLALAAFVAAYRDHIGTRTGNAGMIVAGLIGLALAIYLGVAEEPRELGSIGPGGFDDLSRRAGEVANPGVGIYVAGIGAALVLLGSFNVRRPAGDASELAGMMTTPTTTAPPKRADPSSVEPVQRKPQAPAANGPTAEGPARRFDRRVVLALGGVAAAAALAVGGYLVLADEEAEPGKPSSLSPESAREYGACLGESGNTEEDCAEINPYD